LLIVLILFTVFFKNSYIQSAFFDLLRQSDLDYSIAEINEIMALMTENIWEYHIYFGISLAVLFLLRIVLFFTVSGSKAIREAKLYFSKKETKNSEVKSVVYLAFYIVLIIVLISGLILHFSSNFTISESAYAVIAGIHEVFMNVIFMFIIIHIVGVVIGENSNHKGIVSKMINGGEDIERKSNEE